MRKEKLKNRLKAAILFKPKEDNNDQRTDDNDNYE